MFAGFTEEDLKQNKPKSSIRAGQSKPKPRSTPKPLTRLSKDEPEDEARLPEAALFSANKKASDNPDLLKNLDEAQQPQTSIDDSSDLPQNEAKIEDMEALQKKMEEENRRKKDCLLKAIQQRRQQTSQESQKLLRVQEELGKIDLHLSNDVSVLRKKIEEASLKFMEAQKRYDKAEKEFIDAKLAVHSSKEKKELLTEHLGQIIQQNEIRKAEKLELLMAELNLTNPDASS